MILSIVSFPCCETEAFEIRVGDSDVSTAAPLSGEMIDENTVCFVTDNSTASNYYNTTLYSARCSPYAVWGRYVTIQKLDDAPLHIYEVDFKVYDMKALSDEVIPLKDCAEVYRCD